MNTKNCEKFSLKMLILSPSNTFQDNGITVRAKRIDDLLCEKLKVVLISSKNERFDNNIILVKESFLWMFRLIPKLVSQNFDCVYCSSDYFGFLVCYPFSKIFSYKIIYEAHGILSEETKERGSSKFIIKLCQLLENFVIIHADYVIALSKDILKYYSKYNKNIELIPVFIDEDIFTKDDSKSTNLSDSNIIKKIGVIGPFNMPSNKYALDFVYEHLDEFNKNIQFIIIGNCNNHISSKKVMYTGYLTFTDYLKQLQCLDAVIVPSKIATSGPLNKILEPMACSLPVFTSPKGITGIDYAKPGDNVFIFENSELVYNINKLIFNADLMKKVGQNARDTIEKYYSKRNNRKLLIKVISKITSD